MWVPSAFSTSGDGRIRSLVTANSGATTALTMIISTASRSMTPPFLGAGSVSGESRAASTGSWTISSDSMTPVIAEQNPMTFYMYNFNYLPDWCWDSNKTAYDPCRAGWRVPDGGEKGIWVTASGNAKDFKVSGGSRGLNFSSVFGSDATIWYPAAGYLNYDDGSLNVVGIYGGYWSVTPYFDSASSYYLYFISNGNVLRATTGVRTEGLSVASKNNCLIAF